jgi:starch phosphorylase
MPIAALSGIHRSLPIYSGRLGCLAGDILKGASDLRLPMVGVGILYRQGYFHQRVDAGGWQREYWYETDPERRPAVRVTDADGHPIQVTVPIWGKEIRWLLRTRPLEPPRPEQAR